MAFDKVTTRTPKNIGAIVITLKDLPANPDAHPPTEAVQTATIQVDVLDADGQPLTQYVADLLRHITTQQANTLRNFMALMRTKAGAEVVPTVTP